MEGILIACITGVLSLLGVIFTNMFSNRAIENKLTTAQAVTDTKIDMLTEEVKKHNNFAARMPVVEQQISEINRRVDSLEHSFKKGDDGK